MATGYDLDTTAERVAQLVRFMWEAHRPRKKKLEIDLELLKLDILKYTAIKLTLDEIASGDGDSQ